MKKLFTIDDIAVAFVSALGYGFGATISKLSGWPAPLCMVASLVLGLVVESIVSKIAFSKAIQNKPINRIITYVTIFLIFLIAQYISVSRLGVSMIDNVKEQLIYVVGFPILGFIVNLIIRWYRVQKIRKLYGDGNQGFVFDVKKEDIEGLNQQNRTVEGEYDANYSVKTKTGTYIGNKYKNTIYFLGVPYAKSPVGELRWKAPEPLPASDAVFEAKSFGPSAIQVELNGSILKNHRQSEDCLSLNICVGTKKTSEKKPVLVLFHNGDFTYGGAADPLMYGSNFVNSHQDIVFVSFNYRLGIFGFIDFSEVPGGEAYPDTLNLGLLDQVAALKWIKENIACFGGDPEQISVLGFASGATSILLLAASGQGKDLFRKAFVFNGSPMSVYDTPDGARTLAKNLLKETQTTSMAELMKLDTESLKDAAQRLWQNMCAPTCDGKWLPIDLYRAFQDGAASGIEFIIGIPGNETQVYRSIVGDRNYEDIISIGLNNLRNSNDDSIANEVNAYIEAQKASLSESEAQSKFIEKFLAACVYRVAEKLSEGGNKSHIMYWDQKPLIEKLGSGTVDAAAVLLGNSEAAEMYGSVMDADLSETLQNLLQKFIKGEALQLYHNEIKGVDAIDWVPYPKALIVTGEKLVCDKIEDRMSGIMDIVDHIVK
ncbi:MAG: carboxylesterase/lipase family protein [Anaerolineaceae bacterium]|nr:carboxylesterase/lipase family protein [Anaerolineaceae bacterium]